jgi:hypothetical protein
MPGAGNSGSRIAQCASVTDDEDTAQPCPPTGWGGHDGHGEIGVDGMVGSWSGRRLGIHRPNQGTNFFGSPRATRPHLVSSQTLSHTPWGDHPRAGAPHSPREHGGNASRVVRRGLPCCDSGRHPGHRGRWYRGAATAGGVPASRDGVGGSSPAGPAAERGGASSTRPATDCGCGPGGTGARARRSSTRRRYPPPTPCPDPAAAAMAAPEPPASRGTSRWR